MGLRIFILCCSLCIFSTSAEAKTYKVTARAYTKHKAQTDSNPEEMAFSKNAPKGKALAVSRDLRKLKHKRIKIINCKTKKVIGIYVVKDVMHKRHKKSIDLCFGYDKKKAKEFGAVPVEIKVLK